MKASNLIGAAAAATYVLLTSCLGEGSNSFSNTGFGVGGISEKSYKTVLNTAYGTLYSPNVSILPDACYLASFEVDLRSDENANVATNGYYVATISGLQEVVKGNTNFYNTPDTTALLDNEIALTNVASGTYTGTYIDKYMFLGIAYNARKNQVNQYSLYWNQTTLDEKETEDGVSTYSLFLRAKKTSEGSGETLSSTSEYQAFKIGDVLESIMKKEGQNGAETFNLKINYLSNINEKDSTDLTWSSVTIPCATIQE